MGKGRLDWGEIDLLPLSTLKPQIADEAVADQIARHVDATLPPPAEGITTRQPAVPTLLWCICDFPFAPPRMSRRTHRPVGISTRSFCSIAVSENSMSPSA